MTSKIINLFKLLLILLIFLCSCKTHKKEILKPIKGTSQVILYQHYKYDSDFSPKIKLDNKNFGSSFLEEWFIEGGVSFGKTGIENSKEGKWLSGDADFDDDGNVYAKGKIWKEEYFKNGLKDSIFRQFDNEGKIIYETTFKMGTGLWKEFHGNGTLYFEMYTKDGYFTDTLRLHNYNGEIVGKRFYIKDFLVYKSGLPCFPSRPDSVPSD